MSQSSPALTTRPTAQTRTTCRLCGGQWLIQFLDLGSLHLSDFPLPHEPDPPRVPLRLAMCSSCQLIQLMDTTDPELLYRKFWYRSGTNHTMREELRRLTALAAEHGRSGPGAVWIDIGANDGTLLALAPPGTRRIAFEPALNLREQLLLRADEVHSTFFHSSRAPNADVIFTAAMFYDLDSPVAFTEEIRQTLKPDGVWINQLSYTPAMLEKLAFDNVCHEHLAYYTLETLEKVYAQADLAIRDVTLNDINGGSMCVVASHVRDNRKESARVAELRSRERFSDLSIRALTRFASNVRAWKHTATQTLDYLASQMPIHLYGASTKGNTLLQYLEADRSWFQAAADRNPEKQGRVTAGTRIPIISEEESRAKRPGAYFVLPWAFRDEFLAREAQFLKDGGKLIFPLPNLEVVHGPGKTT